MVKYQKLIINKKFQTVTNIKKLSAFCLRENVSLSVYAELYIILNCSAYK